MLAIAISIDFNYFSYLQRGIIPIPLQLPIGREATSTRDIAKIGIIDSAIDIEEAIEGTISTIV